MRFSAIFCNIFGVIYGLLLGLLAVATYQNHTDVEKAAKHHQLKAIRNLMQCEIGWN
jgi:hypothetical protein